LSFEENEGYLRSVGAAIVEPRSGEEFRGYITACLLDVMRERIERSNRVSQKIRVALDISSMSRDRIAWSITAMLDDVFPTAATVGFEMDISIVYAPAAYTADGGTQDPARISSAVEGFEGWTSHPDRPAVAIIGAGFERDFALAALEALEPADVWLFVPHSAVEPRYNDVVAERTAALSGELGSQTIAYPVEEPYFTFMQLEDLVSRLTLHSRPVLVPLGPKIFSAIAFLVARMHAPEVAVWRVSAGSERLPVDKRPAGSLIGLRIKVRVGSHEDAMA
jgi:hypothetical protein